VSDRGLTPALTPQISDVDQPISMRYNESMTTTAMPKLTVTATARLNAPPRRVYDTISNYHTDHPRILPKQFSGLKVEQGGIGAGTIIRFDMRVIGRSTSFRAVITEPEPGRVLVEKNIMGNDAVSTFLVEPGGHANESVATIRTEMSVRRGWAGAIERFLITRLLNRLYAEELRLLEAVAGRPAETAV
jgi:polyketide cyclase/dehydrase/lipid transport protein